MSRSVVPLQLVSVVMSKGHDSKEVIGNMLAGPSLPFIGMTGPTPCWILQQMSWPQGPES